MLLLFFFICYSGCTLKTIFSGLSTLSLLWIYTVFRLMGNLFCYQVSGPTYLHRILYINTVQEKKHTLTTILTTRYKTIIIILFTHLTQGSTPPSSPVYYLPKNLKISNNAMMVKSTTMFFKQLMIKRWECFWWKNLTVLTIIMTVILYVALR